MYLSKSFNSISNVFISLDNLVFSKLLRLINSKLPSLVFLFINIKSTISRNVRAGGGVGAGAGVRVGAGVGAGADVAMGAFN